MFICMSAGASCIYEKRKDLVWRLELQGLFSVFVSKAVLCSACADPCPACIFYSLLIFRELVVPYIPYVDTALDIYAMQEASHL